MTFIRYKCDGAGARHLVRGLLKAWLVYIDVALPPSSAPYLDIFVYSIYSSTTLHSFKLRFRGICLSCAAFVQAVTLYQGPQSYAGCGIISQVSGFRSSERTVNIYSCSCFCSLLFFPLLSIKRSPML